MNLLYVKVAIGALLLCGCFYGYVEHNRFETFKREVQVQAEKQEAKNESVKAQQDLVNKGIKNEYEAKLAAVRNYYSGLQRNPSGSSVPGISNPAIGTNESPAYYKLAESCSETTVQVIALQDWILQQAGVK